MSASRKTLKITSAVLIISIICSLICSGISLSYEAGNEYKNSYYYTAVTDIELTGDQRYDVISIALSQLGYHTGDSESEMDGKNILGVKSFAEYNRIYGKVDNGQGNGISYGYYWCACFASWCLRQAGVSKDIVPTKCASRKILTALNDQGMYAKASSGYIPLCGDLIFFRNADSSNVTHIGFVIGVKGSTVYTVEGNGNEHVTARSYSLDDPYIEGYGKIKYNTVKGMSYDFALTATEEIYFPYSCPTEVNVYSQPGEKNQVIHTFPAETPFDIYQVKGCWVKVNTPNGYGWCDITDGAQVIPSIAYAVKYYLCGGSGGSLDQISYTGEAITLCKTPPIRTGYTFKGWAETPGGNVKYHPGDTYTGASGDSLKELFAIWEANTYNVKYLDESGNVLLEKTVPYGSKTPTVTAPEKESDETYRYKFNGWSPSAPPLVFGDAVYTPVYTPVKLVPDTTTVQETKAPETDPPITDDVAPETDAPAATEELTEAVTEAVTENVTETADTTGNDTAAEEPIETALPDTDTETEAQTSSVTSENSTEALHHDAVKKSPVSLAIAVSVIALASIITASIIFAVKKRNE